MAAQPALFVVDDNFADEVADAMEKAGKLLSVRARSERELADRLAEAGFVAEVVAQTLTRLVELGLVDDLDFARQWVADRSARKKLGPRALQAELTAKGISREVIGQALADEGPDEEALAIEAAAAHLRKVARFPLAQQAAKLQQMLARKGFSFEAAEAGARAVLPPEGWD